MFGISSIAFNQIELHQQVLCGRHCRFDSGTFPKLFKLVLSNFSKTKHWKQSVNKQLQLCKQRNTIMFTSCSGSEYLLLSSKVFITLLTCFFKFKFNFLFLYLSRYIARCASPSSPGSVIKFCIYLASSSIEII